MAVKGIDVSQYQGSIDFEKVKAAGIGYVMIRAGYGRYASQKDPCFEANYKGAKAAGLPVGVYWYSYAKTEAEARQEAAVCLEIIKGKQFEYPIYFDLEESSQFRLGKSACSGMVSAFCSELEKAGYFAGLYISRSPLQTYITSEVANRYALWIAEYASRCNYSGSYGMWQYSSSGTVPGISGKVDMDYCYEDYPTLIKTAGLNGYKKTTKSGAKALDTSGFKKGDTGPGVLALKQLLILAKAKGLTPSGVDNNDIFGAGTYSTVNSLLGFWGYLPNGIAGENFIKTLGEKLR